ncbi:trypsin-5 [Hyalella azteca]|uniref:Trypsin-5 n=1 Tax=Hyalella azteca TaxID=294128 RepID=A0A8B7NIC3_HYAAZ|nr:trypsin-5 [Hyalella azteca]
MLRTLLLISLQIVLLMLAHSFALYEHRLFEPRFRKEGKKEENKNGHSLNIISDLEFFQPRVRHPTQSTGGTCPFTCGVTIPTERKSGLEIAGGTIVAHGEHPWVVRIVKTYPDGTTLCGGTILNSMNILTAAHCFKDTEGALITVEAGSVLLKPVESSDLQSVEVAYATVHPQYDHWKKHSSYDVAVAVLKWPLQFVLGRVAPVCLSPTPPFEGLEGLIMGWGYTGFNSNEPSPYLLKATIQVKNQELCERAYQLFNVSVSKDQFCASELNKDSCRGDSGGPFLVKIEDKWRQVGLVSYGAGCAIAEFPGIYSLVGASLDWILSAIQGGDCPHFTGIRKFLIEKISIIPDV